jgi:hypothetical protein
MQASEKVEDLDGIITGDEIPTIPSIDDVPIPEVSKLKYSFKSYNDKEIKPGFLDVNFVDNKGKFYRNERRNKYPRFVQKFMAGQDEDFYNKDSGSTDPNNPTKEIEIIRKEGVSNGIILVDKKRICNFETSKYPEYYMDLRKD